MSQLAKKYNKDVFDKAWASIVPTGGITVGTLIHHARQSGWIDQERHPINNPTLFETSTEEVFTLKKMGRILIPLTPPPPRDYVWDEIMVAGKANILGGFGGVSKSQFTLQLSMSINLGFNFGFKKCAKGATLLFMSEDDNAEIERRLGASAQVMKLRQQDISEIERLMLAVGMVGLDTRLNKMVDKRIEDTELTQTIIDTAKSHGEETGEQVRLIVLDHAGTFHGGDFNAKEDVSFTMRIINRIASETGANVLLLAHSPKTASGKETSDANDIAGSTAFVDHARGALVLTTMRANEASEFGISDDERHSYVCMTVVKNNYGPPGKNIWFTRKSPVGWDVGVLEEASLHKPIKNIAKGAGAKQRVKEFIIDHPGRFSKTAIRDKYSGKQGQLKASKNEVDVAIDEMLSSGEVIARSPTDAERKQFSIPKQTSSVLEVSKDDITD
jgi:hypothetical protein